MGDLKDTNLHPFTIKALEQNGVYTQRELAETSLEQLRSFIGVGPKRLAEIFAWQEAWHQLQISLTIEMLPKRSEDVVLPGPIPPPLTFWQRIRNLFR